MLLSSCTSKFILAVPLPPLPIHARGGQIFPPRWQECIKGQCIKGCQYSGDIHEIKPQDQPTGHATKTSKNMVRVYIACTNASSPDKHSKGSSCLCRCMSHMCLFIIRICTEAVSLGVAITTTANPCKGWPDLVAETTTVHQRPVAQRMSIFRGDIHELKPTDHATSHMPVVMIAM